MNYPAFSPEWNKARAEEVVANCRKRGYRLVRFGPGVPEDLIQHVISLGSPGIVIERNCEGVRPRACLFVRDMKEGG